MSVNVTKEPFDNEYPLERCCICRKPTQYWFGTGDRNVALCPSCAVEANESELPLKKDWVAKERSLTRSFI